MIEQIPIVGTGKTLAKVGEQGDLLAAFANAFRNASFVEGDDDQWDLDITDGNVVITYPNNLGGNGGNGGQLLYWYVTVAGQGAVAQFVSTPPVSYGNVPAGTIVQNPP